MKVGVFDVESNGLLEAATCIWCVVVKDINTGVNHSIRGVDVDRIKRVLDEYDVLIGHNSIAFDFPLLRKLIGYEYEGKKVDTLLMSRLQRPNRKGGHSVKAWGETLGLPKVENEVWDVFTPLILERCVQDVEIQEKIYHALMEEGKDENWSHAHKLNAKLFHYLQLQEEYGWTVDRDQFARNIRSLRRWIRKIDNVLRDTLPQVVVIQEAKLKGEVGYVRKPFTKSGDLAAIAIRWLDAQPGMASRADIGGVFSRVSFRPVDLSKSKETKEMLLMFGWQPKEWNEDAEGNRTSPKLSKDDPFAGIEGALGRLIARRVQCRQRLGVLRGWLECVRDDGRIPTPVAGIAATGRLRHKSIVNVPSPHSNAFFAKQMRQIFCAQPGWIHVGVDSKGNQVRQLAARMGDDEFTEAVLYGSAEDGTDVHSVNQRKSGAASRSKAKNFLYGLLFGAGPAELGRQIGVSKAAAKALLDRYLSEMPRLRELIANLTLDWKTSATSWYEGDWGKWVFRDGFITGLDGRPVLVDSEHKVLCYQLQSDEAIQMATAYVMVHKWAERDGLVRGVDWGMLYWGHDEFQMEAKDERTAHNLGLLACKAITWAGEYYNIKCRHDGEALFGSNWYDTH